MRLILPILVFFTLVVAYVGGLNSRGGADKDLLTVASFKKSLAERDRTHTDCRAPQSRGDP